MRVSVFVRFIVTELYKNLKKDENKYLQLCFTSTEILPTFQYTTITMMIFCTCKNLLNNKKAYTKVAMLTLILKTKWYHSCSCSDNSRSWEQLKKQIIDKYFEKKVRL